ncbi:DUF1800 domain-containing protein [Shewanella abyssi]|uniref:DUF1800 domain-containing protein n=1 Tax=Shewanella abyssi TaxID=311789 RepID=UPI00200BDBAF|nr:DUF1800 domain-containing protein [Shewanella abyssi]MCL1049577.1 DUF1800 domain-containing protein [Shewanella abyssi]
MYVYLLVIAIFMLGCGGQEGDDPSPTQAIPQISIAPMADYYSATTTEIILSATAVIESGEITEVLWQQTDGLNADIRSPNALNTAVYLSLPTSSSQAYTFELTVTGSEGTTASKSISFSHYLVMDKFQAARLLHQGTMGPTLNEITQATGLTGQQWLQDQIELPITHHLPLLQNYPEKDSPTRTSRLDTWWKASLNAPDQLRQRVAFALSQIFVVSDESFTQPAGQAHYYDLLLNHSFGNYRELLEAVTLSPIMGRYLSHLGNQKGDPNKNIRPDENYAREVMQLFSIGLTKLNLDGSNRLDENGQTIPTFNQTEVEGLAKVFTGWTYANRASWTSGSADYINPMQAWANYHSTAEKHLLNGVILPAGQSAELDLQQALDNLANHPNVAPFISKLLIQRLVTSNPTPQYIGRISSVFNDNGQGGYGDLGAVVTAILLDDEARQHGGVIQYVGKVREPILRTVQLWRETNAQSNSGWYFINTKISHGQQPLSSPSVFNFYQSDYIPTNLTVLKLYAPEMQIATSTNLISYFNFQHQATTSNIASNNQITNEYAMLANLDYQIDLYQMQGLNSLLDYYDTVFLSGQLTPEMGEQFTLIFNHFSNKQLEQRIGNLLFAVINSPAYVVQQ